MGRVRSRGTCSLRSVTDNVFQSSRVFGPSHLEPSEGGGEGQGFHRPGLGLRMLSEMHISTAVTGSSCIFRASADGAGTRQAGCKQTDRERCDRGLQGAGPSECLLQTGCIASLSFSITKG